MCNAWNHSQNCTCGWGGTGHLGRREQGHPLFSNLFRPERTFATYVDPSAVCPVCGQPVFFVQTANGGRVFFDELGPPWPKHPCTDRVATRTARASHSVAPRSTAPYRWQSDGWKPWLISSVSGITSKLLRATGRAAAETEITLYIAKQHLTGHADPAEYLERSHLHLKQRTAGMYSLAILGPSLQPTNATGYLSTLDAINAASPSQRPPIMLRRARPPQP